MDIERLLNELRNVPPSIGGEYRVSTLLERRVHIARSAGGGACLFIEGSPPSDRHKRELRGLSYSDQVLAVPEGRTLSAVRIDVGPGDGPARLLAHITYEVLAALQDDPELSNLQLLARVEWILALLGQPGELLSAERRLGLLGELFLLRRLVACAIDIGVGSQAAIERWYGWDTAKRDFAGGGIAIEVKTTAREARLHHVGSLAQLTELENEELYLFSLGQRFDRSAPKKLPQHVEDVRQLCLDAQGRPDVGALELFEECVRAYGYHEAAKDVYLADAGTLAPHLPPQFYRVPPMPRLTTESFVGGTVPDNVGGIEYDLVVSGEPLSVAEERSVLLRLLGG